MAADFLPRRLTRTSCAGSRANSRIGSPSIDALPMIPHDFVILGTNERPTVRENRVMIGANVITCDRLRQRLLPSSCIERVHLEVAQSSPIVEAVNVDTIICAGL